MASGKWQVRNDKWEMASGNSGEWEVGPVESGKWGMGKQASE